MSQRSLPEVTGNWVLLASVASVRAKIRPVVKKYTSSKTTKVSPLFDVSAKCHNGSDSEEGEGRLIAQTKKITGDASMKMTKWSSNNQIVADKILKEFDPFVDVTSDNTKVLGLKWNPKEDYFSFNKLPAPFDVAITK
ncbi:hypothetical protein RRG08_031514 [Elysia crispata]|uniref:Uncharacterized protein n=1 Tax=Elysia crispata TaxID=231223 RepID=A0AAE0XYF6_9GAST|nr:hypothetical protein RRG08_031514 [Elysia crispata]